MRPTVYLNSWCRIASAIEAVRTSEQQHFKFLSNDRRGSDTESLLTTLYLSLSLSALLSICSLVHIIHFRQVLKLTYPTYLLIRPLRLLMCKNNNLYIWLSNPSIFPSFRPSFLPPSHAHEFIVDLHSQTSSSFSAQTDADALRFILLYEQTWNTTRQQTAPCLPPALVCHVRREPAINSSRSRVLPYY